jgi:hypothetical protein
MWRRLWENKALSTNVRIDEIAKVYCAQLRERGFTYVEQIRMRDDLLDRPKYRLVFCTRSPDGIELMSQFACDYERELFERHHADSFELYWEEDRRKERLALLRDEIHTFGAERGPTTLREIRHGIVPYHFGEFRRPEYDNAVRELVDLGGIDRPNRRGIKDHEPLRFVALPAAQSAESGRPRPQRSP